MSTMFVQFSDSSETTITSVFGCSQDPDFYPNQGTVETDDERYMAYLASIPSYIHAGLPTS